jgi:hypothetical protein
MDNCERIGKRIETCERKRDERNKKRKTGNVRNVEGGGGGKEDELPKEEKENERD